MENSPYYAEIMRSHYFTDHNRLRIRRAISLRHRPTSHQPRHHLEDRQSNAGSVSSYSSGNNNSLSNVRTEDFEQTILVDDVSNKFCEYRLDYVYTRAKFSEFASNPECFHIGFV